MGKRRKRKNKVEYVYTPPKIEYIYNTNYKLQVNNSLIKNGGLGVFTLEDIPNNQLIGEYIGEKKHIDSPVLSCYCLTLESDYYIDAYDYPRGILAMINDCRFSDNIYNCQFKVEPDKAEVWSISNITSGSELYLDYGDEYWKHR